ncbi:hypothetical protein [Collimonas sp.]|jgi:hypothetical protein|uniref:hypothetical protein n=1 Tax=Collimonas sp. TaxID=1963772 RepID=UPI002C2081A2|nr:hypothetical protein [Collimonas sp.]HWX01549.1 hypothetical protein [Collimonas sp.]
MIAMGKKCLYVLCLAASSSFCLGVSTAHAATLTSEGHAAGAQCGASGVNNTGVVTGSCNPGNGTGAAVAYVSATLGAETTLPAIATGQTCGAGGITNSGVIVGRCADANDNVFAVTWNANAPTNPPTLLNPLPGLLGLGEDVSTGATGFDQLGAVIGESVSPTGTATAVLWPAGSSSAIAVSSPGDNCGATDVNNTLVNGEPSVALNCPNAKGTNIAKIAQYTPLGYEARPLPLPQSYSYCTVAGINNSLQAVGTCHTLAPDKPATAFWSTITSAPTMLTLVGNPINAAQFINNRGHVIFSYQTSTGQSDSGYWDPVTGVVKTIPDLLGGTRAGVAGFADNDTAVVNSDDANETVEAAMWTFANGTVPIGFEGGGVASALSAISENGQYGVGAAENSGHNLDAVRTQLP